MMKINKDDEDIDKDKMTKMMATIMMITTLLFFMICSHLAEWMQTSAGSPGQPVAVDLI